MNGSHNKMGVLIIGVAGIVSCLSIAAYAACFHYWQFHSPTPTGTRQSSGPPQTKQVNRQRVLERFVAVLEKPAEVVDCQPSSEGIMMWVVWPDQQRVRLSVYDAFASVAFYRDDNERSTLCYVNYPWKPEPWKASYKHANQDFELTGGERAAWESNPRVVNVMRALKYAIE